MKERRKTFQNQYSFDMKNIFIGYKMNFFGQGTVLNVSFSDHLTSN